MIWVGTNVCCKKFLTIPLLTQSARSTKSSTTLRRRWGRICRHTRTYAHAFPARDSAQWSQCAESAHGTKRRDSGGSCQTRYHVYQRQLENTQVTTGQHFTSSGKPSILANVQLMLLVQINKNIKLCVTGFILVCIKLLTIELLEKSLILFQLFRLRYFLTRNTFKMKRRCINFLSSYFAFISSLAQSHKIT